MIAAAGVLGVTTGAVVAYLSQRCSAKIEAIAQVEAIEIAAGFLLLGGFALLGCALPATF